jgi:sulfur carrier protein
VKVVVNGRPTDVPEGTTVRALIESLGLGRGACAAEVNKDLVPRREHETRQLREGDAVEIVSLVGGG